MESYVTHRLQEHKQALAQVEQELTSLAQRQQTLMQEHLRLQGAIAALEEVVIAVPDPVPVDGVQP